MTIEDELKGIKDAFERVPLEWSQARCEKCKRSRPYAVLGFCKVDNNGVQGAGGHWKATGLYWLDRGWVEVSVRQGGWGSESSVYCPDCAPRPVG